MNHTPAGSSVGLFHISRRLWPLNACLVLILLCGAEVAAACSVCLGDPDSQMATGVNNGILVLLGFVGFVQVGFLALFLSLRNRARRLERRRDRFSLIEGGVK